MSEEPALGRVERVLLTAVSELNRQLPPAARLTPSLDAPLTGPGATLDSLGLINFIVITEDKLEEEFGKRISLIDGDAAGGRAEVFATLRTLANHVGHVLDDSI